MTCPACQYDYEIVGQVVCRHLPDGRRAFLPMVRMVPGTPDQRTQRRIDHFWTRGEPMSGRVWHMPLDREDYDADMRIWRQVFGRAAGGNGNDVIECMATWGTRICPGSKA